MTIEPLLNSNNAADIPHFGRNPIRSAWYVVVLPALLLNYAGQTALLLKHPVFQGNPFFTLAPDWAIYPLVVLATVAAIIASQAIITGSFSLTRQAMQLGWFPGLRIRQTSADEYGQIYVPFVNWAMMLLTVALTIVFGSSSRLAAAYGTAVSTTMLLTTLLLYNVMRDRWRWPTWLALLTSGVLLFVDCVFFAANLLKITQGGWIPLTLGVILFIVMTTWRSGIEAVRDRYQALSETPDRFLKRLQENRIPRVPGTSVFLTRTAEGIPAVIIQHFRLMGSLHETVIALTVRFESVPRVRLRERLKIAKVADGFWHISVSYGFIEVPDLPVALREAKNLGCPVDLTDAVYFGQRDQVVRGKHHVRLWSWQLALFDLLFRNSVRAVDLFKLPPLNFVEIGRQLEI
jgi:KUP system potassium uptake protein